MTTKSYKTCTQCKYGLKKSPPDWDEKPVPYCEYFKTWTVSDGSWAKDCTEYTSI